MIVQTDAVVLRTWKHGETSMIARLYTRSFGRLSVIAKGVRGRSPRFPLQPMNVVTCVLYKSEHRDLHLLSQCDTSVPLRRLADDLEKMSVAMSVVGLVDGLAHSEEPNEPLFELLTTVLRLTNDATNSPFPALYLFEVRLLGILGFRPSFHSCPRCGLPVLRSPEEGIPAGRFG
jgi:DNA repair protein RecO (recombination protein O)